MSDEPISIRKYIDEFKTLTGLDLKTSDKEAFSLFFQFVQAKNSIDMKQSAFKQANAIHDFVNRKEKKS